MSQSPFPIIDLHCDLLGCIEYGQGRYHFHSPELNCSLPQLMEGNVKLQVLAVAAITGEKSSVIGERQVQLYQDLLQLHGDQVGPFREFAIDSSKLHCLFGIENASAILDEDEDLTLFFKRIEAYRTIEEILYISLTWNQENRFGGGNLTDVGLKEDGKAVLEYLDGKNIAIDLSHTSDALASDLLEFLHKKSLKIPIIASHSNYRAICPDRRNLPEEIAKEVIRQKGLIGVNFVHRFVGKDPSAFIDHLHYAHSIGGEDVMCLGADFYGGLDIASDLCPGKTPVTFFEEYSNSGCYPRWNELLRTHFSEEAMQKMCYQNVMRFLKHERG